MIPFQFDAPFDAQVVPRLRKGESAALSDIYGRYGSVAYTVILRIVCNHHTAEDLVQETFLKVWTRRDQYDPARGSLRCWVAVIARNNAIDYIKSIPVRNHYVVPDHLEELSNPASNFATDLHEGALSSVWVGFDNLTESQKTVLELAYFKGMSQTEMAVALELPVGTVKSRVRAALLVLRQAISMKVLPFQSEVREQSSGTRPAAVSSR